MKVTPLEIRQQQFPVRFRGLDPTEVDKFLELIAGEMEVLMRENGRLRESLARKDQDIQRLQHGEDELKKALATIQQIRDEWIGRAEKQAEQTLSDAEQRAQQMLLEAEKRLEALQHDVEKVKRQRRQLLSQMRDMLEQHLRLLDETESEPAEAPLAEGAYADLSQSIPQPAEGSEDASGHGPRAPREGSV
jgi:cell division initiation protein